MAATSDVDLRLYIYNPETETLDIPERISLNESKFRAEIFGPEYFSMQIYRREDKESLLFSTSRGPIIASKDYWELSLQFPKEATVFGLGGLRVSSKPKLIYSSGRRLGANPFIIILDADGRAYGILFNIPGPMEFQLLENSNLLIVKSLSTVMWDFSVFAGPTPADVMKQYTSIEGMRPFLPPPWALGLHICRNTTTDSETLAAEDVLYFIKEATARGLLYESDCLQEGFMYQLNFTIPNSMDEAIEEVKATGRKLLLSLPPQVSNSALFNDALSNSS
jgi:alpha-glucosidase (family GH31 glycosyl hydrolase)